MTDSLSKHLWLFLLVVVLCPLVLLAEDMPTSVPDTPVSAPKFEGPTSYRYEEQVPIIPRTVKKKKKKKKEQFRGYSKEKKLFDELCMALYDDGRAMPVSKLSEKYKGGAQDCVACKSFFRLFFTYCKKEPSYVKREKHEIKLKLLRQSKRKKELGDDYNEEEEEVVEPYSPPNKQVDPSLYVIDLVSRIFNILAADTKRIHHHFVAVEILVERLRDEEERTPAAKHYYDVLAEYIKAPFLNYEETKNRVERQEAYRREQRNKEFMFDSRQDLKGLDGFFEEE